MILLVELSIDELLTLRSALGRARLDERARLRRLQRAQREGKSTRIRISEQAMTIADIEMLRTKIHDLITTKGGTAYASRKT